MILEESDVVDYIRSLGSQEVAELVWTGVKTYSDTKEVADLLLKWLEEEKA